MPRGGTVNIWAEVGTGQQVASRGRFVDGVNGDIMFHTVIELSYITE